MLSQSGNDPAVYNYDQSRTVSCSALRWCLGRTHIQHRITAGHIPDWGKGLHRFLISTKCLSSWSLDIRFRTSEYFSVSLCFLIYLLTPWSRVLPEKLKRPELLKQFPAFYTTRRFITVFTRVRHLSISWARLIQSMPPHPTSRRSILISFFHCLGRTKGSVRFRGLCVWFVT
jgi:hypothetical protein